MKFSALAFAVDLDQGHEGVRFVACPASRSGRKVQCISCGGRFGLPLCAQADRGFVITFPAHGARAAAAAAHCS